MKLSKCFLIILVFVPGYIDAQYLKNPSLEGPRADTQPNEWLAVEGHDWSDPDLYYTFRPFETEFYYYPVDSDVFALYRARGTTFANERHLPRQREYSYQQLIKPLESFSCFEFRAWLAFNPNMKVSDLIPELENKGFPLKFQLWGGDTAYSRDTLLIESPVINNLEFKEYIFNFTTGNHSYPWILFEVQWDTINVRPEPYNGYLLVDNLSLVKTSSYEILPTDTVVYKGYGLTRLEAADFGIWYKWEPTQFFDENSIRWPFLLNYCSDVDVSIGKVTQCPSIQHFKILLICDSLYPDVYNMQNTYYYKYEKRIYLNASKGENYSWYPLKNLSEYNVQSPYMTGYNDSYVVNITDENGCTFRDSFKIELACDTLYPEANLLVKDTIVEGRSPVILMPKYGQPVSAWSPGRFLGLINNAVTAFPEISTVYSVTLKDDFGCIHNEIFKIDVELKVPNVITPNLDGYNDCFKIFGLPENSYLFVYTKTGELVYFANPYTPGKCWDGKDKTDRELATGNYWFILGHPDLGTLKTGFVFIKR